MDWPLISIIITAYNYAHLLPVALESVLNQEYPRMEILVLDDASTDETAAVLQAYAGDERVRTVRHEHNLGACANANFGLRTARGEYIALLSADNHWSDGFLSILAQVLVADMTIDIAYGRNLSINAHDHSPIPWQYIPVEYTGGSKLFAHLLTAGCFLCLESALVKREVYDRLGLLSPTVAAADLEILVRWAAHGLRFAHRPAARCITLVHEGQVSAPQKYMASGNLARDYLTILEQYLRPVYAQKIRGFEYGIIRTVKAVGATLPQESLACGDSSIVPSVREIVARIEAVRCLNAAAPREDGVTIAVLHGGNDAELMRSLTSMFEQTVTNWEGFICVPMAGGIPGILLEVDPLRKITLLVPEEPELTPLPLRVLQRVSNNNTFLLFESGESLHKDVLEKLLHTMQSSSLDAFYGSAQQPAALMFRREVLDRYGPCELPLAAGLTATLAAWLRGKGQIHEYVEEIPRTFAES